MITEEKLRELITSDTFSICYCMYLHSAGEIESEWFDCTHPQKTNNICPYKKMKECTLSKPDIEAQEMYIDMVIKSNNFWNEYNKITDREHICDITIDALKKRHENALKLINKYDPITIGLLIAGKYYDNVWNSRSCSAHLANLVGTNDYMDFYCSSSVYFIIQHNNKLLSDFINSILLFVIFSNTYFLKLPPNLVFKYLSLLFVKK